MKRSIGIKPLNKKVTRHFMLIATLIINSFKLLGNEFTKPAEILFIAPDNAIMARVDNGVPVAVNCSMKGIYCTVPS